jgi:hypothetical protein
MKIIRFHSNNGVSCIIGIAIQLLNGSVVVQWMNNIECHVVYKDMDAFNNCNSNIVITTQYEF